MNRTRLRWPLAAVLLGLALGCSDEPTAPAGTPSTIAVRAYVDADGSGTFSAGDVAIASQVVTLANADGAQVAQATTNAEGVATFDNVPPGSYTVKFGGQAPAGAVLASATNPVVVAPFRGGDVSSEFRFVFNPGELSGVIYRDNNGNNRFDPGVDTPAPGIPVLLFAGTSAPADSTGLVASTTTDANGAFRFTTLRAGTYTIRVLPLPTMQIVGGTTATYTIAPAQATAAPVVFTGQLLTPISQARSQPAGSIVAFEGIATVGVGVFSTSTTSNQFNVQDASGGILILQVPLSSGIQQGDSVRVIGTTAISAGEFLITNNPTVTRLASARPLPPPRTVTAAQVAASGATDPLQGSLVRVGNVRVTAVSGSATSTSYNVTVQDDAGNTFVVRVGSAAVGIPQTYWQIGRYYDVTGLLGNFNGPQVKVRSAMDVQQRSLAESIGSVRARAFADSAGTRFDTVTVEGVVHTAQGTFRTDNAFIQDATGGILLFNVPASAALAVGDSVRVTAAIAWFNGELELVRFSSTSPPVIEKLGTAATPQPRTISGTQMLARTFEGQLVRLANARVDSIGTASSSGGYTVWLVTTDGQRVQVRIENNSIGIATSSWTVGNIVNVVGALSHFRGTPQLKPRNAGDVTAGTAGVMSIAAAKQEETGDTVVVEGVVTAPVGIFGSSSGSTMNAYISDGTAGIQIFGVPSTVTLDIGDIVRVRGVRSVFSGEVQISRFSSSSLLEVTELGMGAPPAPLRVTGAEVAARTFEGSLVRLDNVVVVSVGAVSSSGGYNVTARAPDGTTITIRVDRSAVNVPVTTWVVGAAYDVTGILSAFNSAPQLKVRGPFDVVQR